MPYKCKWESKITDKAGKPTKAGSSVMVTIRDGESRYMTREECKERILTANASIEFERMTHKMSYIPLDELPENPDYPWKDKPAINIDTEIERLENNFDAITT